MIDDAALTKSLNSGNLETFKTFFDALYPSLCRYANKFLDDPDQAEDIVQDAFLKFWKMRMDFKSVASPKSYLYSMVRNSCLNYIRHQKISDEFIAKSIKEEVYNRDLLVEEEFYFTIRKAIKTLPPQTQNIIKLSLNGIKNPEIAEQLDISVNTVKTLKRNAYKKLRGLLQGQYYLLFAFFRRLSEECESKA